MEIPCFIVTWLVSYLLCLCAHKNLLVTCQIKSMANHQNRKCNTTFFVLHCFSCRSLGTCSPSPSWWLLSSLWLSLLCKAIAGSVLIFFSLRFLNEVLKTWKMKYSLLQDNQGDLNSANTGDFISKHFDLDTILKYSVA